MSKLGVPVSVEDACASLDAVLDALSYCHQRGHLHRDLKPDNVILRGGDVRDPVLIDFGQTFNAEAQIQGFETETGQQLGNRFMHLPELMTSGADKRNALSDISFCVGLLFFLLTGQRPEALRDHQQRRPDERDPAPQQLGRLPEHQRRQLSRIFAVGFSQEFEQLWQSIPELRGEIRKLSEPSTVALTLKDRVKSIKEAMLNNPEHAIRNQLTQLHGTLSQLVQKSFELLVTELQPIIQASHSGVTFDASLGRGGLTLQFTHTQYGLMLTLALYWHRVQGQIELIGDINPQQHLFGSKEIKGTKLKTVSFADPEIVQVLHNAIEAFVGDTLQDWLERLSRSQ
jgi:serine/threonine protein kinase